MKKTKLSGSLATSVYALALLLTSSCEKDGQAVTDRNSVSAKN